MKPTSQKSHCLPLNMVRSRNGLGAWCIGGLRVEKRVEMYVLMLMSWGFLDSRTGLRPCDVSSWMGVSVLAIFSPSEMWSAMLAGSSSYCRTCQ